MKTSLIVPIAVVSTLVLFYSKGSDALISCYVCEDCSDTFESKHLANCSKSTTKCMKIELMNGEIDRACADKTRCNGRGNGRSKRDLTEPVDDPLPKTRIVRQLLGGGESGSSSSSNSNKNKNKKDKQKEEKPGVKDAKEIHCCAEDECNGTVPMASISFSLLFLGCFLIATITSSVTTVHFAFSQHLPRLTVQSS